MMGESGGVGGSACVNIKRSGLSPLPPKLNNVGHKSQARRKQEAAGYIEAIKFQRFGLLD